MLKKKYKSKLIHTEESLIKHPQSKKIKIKYFEFFWTVHFSHFFQFFNAYEIMSH